jgi:hypothetical protein
LFLDQTRSTHVELIMWSSSSSKTSSSGSSGLFSQHRRTATAESSQKGQSPYGKHQKTATFDSEDAWRLDDDDEDDGDAPRIAQVAAQAGLGRKASATSIPAAVATTASAQASSSSLNLNLSSSNSGRSSPVHLKSPASQVRERGRQTSFGFWERISSFGGGSSIVNAASKNSDEAEASGYSRFDDQLELEDNFDGTYSVAPGGASASAGPQGKLLAAANISRPPLLGGGSAAARSSSKVPQVSPAAQNSKGKGKSVDSPGAATVIGTPRPKSPFVKGLQRDRPRDGDDMRKWVRKDIEDVLEGEGSS